MGGCPAHPGSIPGERGQLAAGALSLCLGQAGPALLCSPPSVRALSLLPCPRGHLQETHQFSAPGAEVHPRKSAMLLAMPGPSWGPLGIACRP